MYGDVRHVKERSVLKDKLIGGAFTLDEGTLAYTLAHPEKDAYYGHVQCRDYRQGQHKIKQCIWQNAPVEIGIYKTDEQKQKISYDVALPVL